MAPDSSQSPWKILVVDDEEGIHGITRMIFRGYQFEQRGIELISAYNGEQARSILKQTEDIALILLDVVMESDNAGLRLIDYVRNNLGNRDIRIILRTGHPGYAPETEVIVDYDINDYLSKAELSASRLLTSVVVALRSYRDITQARQPRQEETHAGLDYRLLHDLGKTLKPLVEGSLQSSRRLKQLALNPVADDLITLLEAQQQRLYSNCLLLGDTQSEGLELQAADPRELLHQLLQTLLPQTRQQGLLLDSRIAEGVPERLSLAIGASNQLWLILCEQALELLEGDLRLELSFDQYGNQLELSITPLAADGRRNLEPNAASPWRQYRDQQAAALCERLGGTLSEPRSGEALRLSCRVPAEPLP